MPAFKADPGTPVRDTSGKEIGRVESVFDTGDAGPLEVRVALEQWVLGTDEAPTDVRLLRVPADAVRQGDDGSLRLEDEWTAYRGSSAVGPS